MSIVDALVQTNLALFIIGFLMIMTALRTWGARAAKLVLSIGLIFLAAGFLGVIIAIWMQV